MSVDIGIIGLPKSGKTTVFNALTSGTASTFTAAPNIGVAKVPDPRMGPLVAMFKPKKITPAEVKYIDIGAATPGSSKPAAGGKKELIGSQLLNEVARADCLLGVVRAFKDDSVPHVEETVNAMRDIVNLNMELAFSDLAILERRAERIVTSMKAAKPAERGPLLKEQELVAHLKEQLEKDIPIRNISLTPEEHKVISNYQFLSAKPLLIVVNIGEDQLGKADELEKEYNAKYHQPNLRIMTLCGKLEAELAQMDAADSEVFRKDLGIRESGLGRVVRESFALLGLISFFTVGDDEVKAWPVTKGTLAPRAAGKIHSDLERGFIRAEVINWNDLVQAGGIPEAKHKGILRQEGKTYVVQDGDVMNILFNV